jgi:hypothetical protein
VPERDAHTHSDEQRPPASTGITLDASSATTTITSIASEPRVLNFAAAILYRDSPHGSRMNVTVDGEV